MPPQISRKRWKTKSTRPPKYPCTAPAAMPITDVSAVTISANATDSRNP